MDSCLTDKGSGLSAQIRVLTAFDVCSSQYPFNDYSYTQYNSTNFLVVYYSSDNGACAGGVVGYSSYAYQPGCTQISLDATDDSYYYYYYGNSTNTTDDSYYYYYGNSTNTTDDSYYYNYYSGYGYYYYYDYWNPWYNMSYIFESFPASGGSPPSSSCSDRISYEGAGEITLICCN